jgi:hypothetical protein
MRKILQQVSLTFLISIFFSSPFSYSQIANQIILDHNNVSCTLSDEGGFFTNNATGLAGYEVPKGDSISSIFAGSIFIGAQDVLGQHFFSGRKYSFGGNESSFHSGPVADAFYYGTLAYFNAYQNALWKVSAAQITAHQQNFQNPGYTIPYSILKWPGNGDVSMGVAQQLAPYIDLNQNGIYEPILGDYPDIRGDEAVYIIMNDESYQPDGNQLGIELHMMFYQFSSGNYLNNTTFLNVKVFNRSNINYVNFNQGVYIDYDIGFYADDHIGCSPEKNMLFAYNGDNFDESDANHIGYGSNPPCQGIVCLSHTLKTGVSLTNNDDYFAYGDTSLWLLMDGFYSDTTPWVDPLTNQITNFIFPDNPNNPNGWSEITQNMPSGDRRGLISIFEPTFRPGSKICSDYAFIYSRVGNNMQNVQSVWNIATSIQTLYNSSEMFICHENPTSGVQNFQSNSEALKIFPNPARDNITIKTAMQAPYMLEIFNSTGQKVLANQMEAMDILQIDIKDLDAGFYVLKLSTSTSISTQSFSIIPN